MTKLERLYKRQEWLDANVLCPYKFNCNNEKCKGNICKERKEYMANEQAIKRIEEKAQHRWIIADCHFSHFNIIKYCDRPYKSIKDMNWDMIKRWNSVVGDNDLVYVLGDFALMYKDKENIQRIMNMLKGKKVLAPLGNHDTRKPVYYISLGFVQATWKPIVIDQNVILSHFPPEFISKDYYYLHGHVHQRDAACDSLRNVFNCSAEKLNYKPYDLDKLIQKLKAGKKLEILNELEEEKVKFLEEKKNDNSKN